MHLSGYAGKETAINFQSYFSSSMIADETDYVSFIENNSVYFH